MLAYADGYVPNTAAAQVAGGGETATTIVLEAQESAATDGYLVGYVYDQWTGAGILSASVTADGSSATAGALGYYSLALAAASYTVTGASTDYLSRSFAGIAIAAKQTERLDIPLHPDTDDTGDLFVAVPAADQIPEGGPGSVLVDYPDDADWDLAIDCAGGAVFRRAQGVPRGIETIVEQTGEDVRILARKTTGQLTGITASLRP